MITEVVTIDELEEYGIDPRSESIDDYYEEMAIEEEQEKERKELAEKLDDIFLFYLVMMQQQKTFDLQEWDYIITSLAVDIQKAITPYLSDMDISDETGSWFTGNYARLTAENYVNTYRAHAEDLYMNSEDRALFYAENEANTVLNRKDYMGALETGNTQKMWLTMEDKRVRPTHEEIDQLMIPIEELFQVGNAVMMYPKDVMNAYDHPEEIVNCRCSIVYI